MLARRLPRLRQTFQLGVRFQAVPPKSLCHQIRSLTRAHKLLKLLAHHLSPTDKTDCQILKGQILCPLHI